MRRGIQVGGSGIEPTTVTLPAVGSSKPVNILTVVDLPEPFGDRAELVLGLKRDVIDRCEAAVNFLGRLDLNHDRLDHDGKVNTLVTGYFGRRARGERQIMVNS